MHNTLWTVSNCHLVTLAKNSSITLLLIFAALPAVAIEFVEVTNLSLGVDSIDFNGALRTDRGPVSGMNPADRYHDADSSLSMLVSPLVPSEVRPDLLRRMPLSHAFWTYSGDVEISYEVVFGGVTFNGSVPTLSRK